MNKGPMVMARNRQETLINMRADLELGVPTWAATADISRANLGRPWLRATTAKSIGGEDHETCNAWRAGALPRTPEPQKSPWIE